MEDTEIRGRLRRIEAKMNVALGMPRPNGRRAAAWVGWMIAFGSVSPLRLWGHVRSAIGLSQIRSSSGYDSRPFRIYADSFRLSDRNPPPMRGQ
jgi:hypothetical protein